MIMDHFDAESNHSYQSDSLQSNASSLSGLSFYGNEFAELRHLVNPSKYPTPYLDRSSTPKAELANIENEEEINDLKTNLQKSLELNKQYKNDLQNLEKQIELKFHDKIDKLLRNNSRLEGELENANNQVERLIKNYKEKNELLGVKEKFDLEKKIHNLNSTNSSLQIHCINLKHERNEVDIENKNLKINLGELSTQREIKTASIQSLKQKISEQHIELQNCVKNNTAFAKELNILNSKLQQSEKSRDWYKDQLHQCQNNKQICNDKIQIYKNQIILLNERVSSLNIEISKYKNDVDRVRLQALKEKEELFKKLEIINLNCDPLNNIPEVLDNNSSSPNDINVFSENNSDFYMLTIEDLKGEISRTKVNIQEREEEFEKLKQENCELIAKCLVLQKSLQQTENSIEQFEITQKEVVKKLDCLKETEKEKSNENMQLKNRVIELEIELGMRNKEKQSVENTIKVIRYQFLKFKENYEKVKSEVNLKNKEILQLQNDKQELFMSNNWTICELEKIKGKDLIIENLKRDILNFEAKISELTQKIRELEFQILKNERVVNEKENTITEKLKELENHNTVIIQYKALTSDYENKINFLKCELKEIEREKIELGETFKIVKEDLKKKNLKLDQALRNIEQLKNDHKHVLDNKSIEKNQMLEYYKTLEENYNCELQEKDVRITDLNNKFKKLENDCDNYVKRITDDQKVEILFNKNITQLGANDVVDFRYDLKDKTLRNPLNMQLLSNNSNFEKLIMNVFNNFNMEEFESTVDIRLKYLDKKVQKIKTRCEEKVQKLKNQYRPDKIKDLEILLQVKDRDMQEKQKKMDRNNRTLLRKVKEHMRGRNSAEKQLKYLQEMYNSLSEERNSLKLSISSKEYKIQTLEKLCEKYKNETDKLRNAVLSLERDLSKNGTCLEKCLEVDQLKEKFLVLEKLCEELQESNIQLTNELRCCKENVIQLTSEVKEQETHNKLLKEKNNNLLEKSDGYETLLTTSKDLENKYLNQNQELFQKLSQKEALCDTNQIIVEGLSQELEHAKENIGFLSDNIKILSSDIRQKVEYSEELVRSKASMENDFMKKNSESQNLIADLKNSLCLLQMEIDRLKNDKFFLQRLSNDLKVALQSYVEQNKNLKGQLDLVTKEKRPFNSLPTNVLDDTSITGKYDETYINQLLEENRTPIKKPLSTEIQSCLSKLREEIFSLQDQIIKKNSLGN